MVPCLLMIDDPLEPLSYLLVGCAAAEDRPQILLGHAKEAGPDLPIRSQTKSIAMAAKGFTDRGNDANFTSTCGEHPTLGSGGDILLARRTQFESSLYPLE